MKTLRNAVITVMFVFAFSCLKSPRIDSTSEAGIESLIKKMLADPTCKSVYIEKDALSAVSDTDGIVDGLFSNRYTTVDFFDNHVKALSPAEDLAKLFEHVCSKFPNVHLIGDYMSDIYYPQNLNEDTVVADYTAKLLVLRPMKCAELKKSTEKLLAFQVTKAYLYRSKASGKIVGYTANVWEGIPDFWFVLVEMKDGQEKSIKIWKNGMIFNGS